MPSEPRLGTSAIGDEKLNVNSGVTKMLFSQVSRAMQWELDPQRELKQQVTVGRRLETCNFTSSEGTSGCVLYNGGA